MAGVVFETKPSKSVTRALYRGIQVQPVKGASRLTKVRIRKAVQAAIDKNADALANAE